MLGVAGGVATRLSGAGVIFRLASRTILKWVGTPYGTLPVVIMTNTKVHGKYVKNTFRQTFYFASGACIIDGGNGNNYYFVKDDGKC